MIAYRDFQPPIMGLFPNAQKYQEGFDQAVVEANEWIARESIEVLNAETIGRGDAAFQARSIRIWYRATGPKPPTSPEL